MRRVFLHNIAVVSSPAARALLLATRQENQSNDNEPFHHPCSLPQSGAIGCAPASVVKLVYTRSLGGRAFGMGVRVPPLALLIQEAFRIVRSGLITSPVRAWF